MKLSRNIFYALIFSLVSLNVSAEINVNVKIDHTVGTKTIESVKNISTDYNQDIVIVQEGLKDKIIITLKKFKDVLVNGNKINPVQIDMKLIDSSKKAIGKTQTVTSFYTNSAQFSLPGRSITLNFQEI